LLGKEGKGLTLCSPAHINETVQIEVTIFSIVAKTLIPYQRELSIADVSYQSTDIENFSL